MFRTKDVDKKANDAKFKVNTDLEKGQTGIFSQKSWNVHNLTFLNLESLSNDLCPFFDISAFTKPLKNDRNEPFIKGSDPHGNFDWGHDDF